jgi:hypothetical protein
MALRLATVVLAGCLLVPYLAGQMFHGTGASITTSSPSRSFSPPPFSGSFTTHGIPPSVTSITPLAPQANFSGGFNFGHRRHHFGKGIGAFPVFVPVYYPYSYGYPGFYPDASTTISETDLQQQEPEPPALTVFERRPGYQPPPVRSDARDYRRSDTATSDTRDRQEAPERTSEPEQKVADQTPTILVFRDGHRLEISNYAIQGETLYNLGAAGPRKIKLADLDLDKTMKLNDERGNEFRLPKSARG